MGEADVILGIKIKRENKGILKPNTGKPVDQLEYSRAIGCLMYAMTSTRPDIAYVVTMNYSLSYVDILRVRSLYNASWINQVEEYHFYQWDGVLLGGCAFHGLPRSKHASTGFPLWNLIFVALAAAGKEAYAIRNLDT
ncbi:hypothetical protein Tco_0174561 [Tanacetum coccineum]